MWQKLFSNPSPPLYHAHMETNGFTLDAYSLGSKAAALALLKKAWRKLHKKYRAAGYKGLSPFSAWQDAVTIVEVRPGTVIEDRDDDHPVIG